MNPLDRLIREAREAAAWMRHYERGETQGRSLATIASDLEGAAGAVKADAVFKVLAAADAVDDALEALRTPDRELRGPLLDGPELEELDEAGRVLYDALRATP